MPSALILLLLLACLIKGHSVSQPHETLHNNNPAHIILFFYLVLCSPTGDLITFNMHVKLIP